MQKPIKKKTGGRLQVDSLIAQVFVSELTFHLLFIADVLDKGRPSVQDGFIFHSARKKKEKENDDQHLFTVTQPNKQTVIEDWYFHCQKNK